MSPSPPTTTAIDNSTDRQSLRGDGHEKRLRFEVTSRGVEAIVRRSDTSEIRTLISRDHRLQRGADALSNDDAEQLWLRSRSRPTNPSKDETIVIADLFCGSGGLSLGLREACTVLGYGFKSALAIDMNADALGVYERNHEPNVAMHANIAAVFDGSPNERMSVHERKMLRSLPSVDVLLGGPPCEGHSDFNNRTRNNDTRNSLYLKMVRAAELLSPSHVVIENVPGALRDRQGVVQRSIGLLEGLGYHVSHDVVDLQLLGVAQRRRRLVVVAAKHQRFDFRRLELHRTNVRNLRWAIEDLVDVNQQSLMDQPANSAALTRQRIEYLFRKDIFELPDSERPDCHKQKSHTYTSIYGRLRWDEPAQTITSGFYSMCMGRYVHPARPRTLTAHEAARIQFLPDYHDFSSVKGRTALARLIGDAVPMKLGLVLGLELLH